LPFSILERTPRRLAFGNTGSRCPHQHEWPSSTARQRSAQGIAIDLVRDRLAGDIVAFENTRCASRQHLRRACRTSRHRCSRGFKQTEHRALLRAEPFEDFTFAVLRPFSCGPLVFALCMILSENRYPLFGIMHYLSLGSRASRKTVADQVERQHGQEDRQSRQIAIQGALVRKRCAELASSPMRRGRCWRGPGTRARLRR